MQWHISFHLSWEITYFCAKFQRLTPNRLRVYKEQTHTRTEIEIYIYIYIDIDIDVDKDIDIESSKFWKNWQKWKNL